MPNGQGILFKARFLEKLSSDPSDHSDPNSKTVKEIDFSKLPRPQKFLFIIFSIYFKSKSC